MSHQLTGTGIKRIPILQRTQAWHDWRNGVDLPDGRPRITATAATVIAGDSVSGQTPHQLWMEMTGKKARAEPSDFVKKAMEHGTRTEDKARQAYIEHTGNDVVEACVEHPLHPWCGASLDGLPKSGDIPVEIKCPVSQRVHKMARDQTVPSYYYVQVQWQLMCVPMAVEAHYWSYFEDDEDGEKGALVVVKRDDMMIARLFNEALTFRTCVVEDRPPASDEWLIAAKLYREAKIEMDQAASRVDTAQKRLVELLPLDKDKFDGGGVMVSRYSVKGKVDYAKVFEELKPDADLLHGAIEAARAPGEVDYGKVFAALAVPQEVADGLCDKYRAGGELRHRFTQVQGYVPLPEPTPPQAEAVSAAEQPLDGQDWSW